MRRALAMCFDWDAFIKGYYKGLAERVTGEQFLRGPAYDPTLAPLPFDVAQARALLAEAGWHDSDADGRVDQGGAPQAVKARTNKSGVGSAFALVNAARARSMPVCARLISGLSRNNCASSTTPVLSWQLMIARVILAIPHYSQ